MPQRQLPLSLLKFHSLYKKTSFFLFVMYLYWNESFFIMLNFSNLAIKFSVLNVNWYPNHIKNIPIEIGMNWSKTYLVNIIIIIS